MNCAWNVGEIFWREYIHLTCYIIQTKRILQENKRRIYIRFTCLYFWKSNPRHYLKIKISWRLHFSQALFHDFSRIFNNNWIIFVNYSSTINIRWTSLESESFFLIGVFPNDSSTFREKFLLWIVLLYIQVWWKILLY